MRAQLHSAIVQARASAWSNYTSVLHESNTYAQEHKSPSTQVPECKFTSVHAHERARLHAARRRGSGKKRPPAAHTCGSTRAIYCRSRTVQPAERARGPREGNK